MAPEMTLSDVRAELARGSRVLLLVRHAERPTIAFDDKTFGGTLPLTPAGERMSEDFGRLLAGASDDVQFRASPLLRTVMTAERIATGMGIAGAEIPTDPLIGNDCAFVHSQLEVWETFSDGGFFTKMIEYLQKGTLHGFVDLAEATPAFERYLLSQFTGRFGIFTSHDCYIAAFLQGVGAKTDFSRENWPRFLDAAAIVLGPDGTTRYALVRAGLSDRITGVA